MYIHPAIVIISSFLHFIPIHPVPLHFSSSLSNSAFLLFSPFFFISLHSHECLMWFVFLYCGVVVFFFNSFLPSTPFTQCPIHFLPHLPSVLSTYHFSPFKLPNQTSIFFSTLMSGWLVLMVSLVEWIFVVVLWFFCFVVWSVLFSTSLPSTPFTQCTFNFLLPLT